jgi:prepilin-type N-terminal cleavage/methylation domain-containing protein
MNHNETKRGFSLLEMMIVIAILALVMFVVSTLLMAATKAYRSSVALQQMNMRCVTALNRITRDLGNAHVEGGGLAGTGGTGATAGNSYFEIIFQVPVLQDDGNGNMLPFDPATWTYYWGADGQLNMHIRYVFDLPNSTQFDEAVDGIDYNRDGDTADKFRRGRILRQIVSSMIDPDNNIVSSRPLTGNYIVIREPAEAYGTGGDNADNGPNYQWANGNRKSLLDGDMDGFDDPMFLIVDDNGAYDPVGTNIKVSVFTMERFDDRTHVVRRDIIVYPINKLSPH